MFRSILLIISLLFCFCNHHPEHNASIPGDYKRIISFAPSITETLFALGLGNRVVGVTRFCTYPPQVKNIPNIGGYVDPNYEMVLSLKPDLVFLLKEHAALISFLQKNNIKYQLIDNETVKNILLSFHLIGKMCNSIPKADSLIANINREMDTIKTTSTKPRILFCIGRDNPGSGVIAKIFIAGPRSFYSQLITYSGAENVYTDSNYAYPSISTEGIIKLNPDIIIDVMSVVTNANSDLVKKDWLPLTMIPAVKKDLVFCPIEDFMTIPGPRLGEIVKKIKAAVKEYHDKNTN